MFQTFAQMYRKREDAEGRPRGVSAPFYEKVYIPNFRPGERILDFGCGQADYVRIPQKREIRIWGLEGGENPFADMLPQDLFAAALAEDHQVVAAEPAAIAEAIAKAVKRKVKKKQDALAAPPAPTHALIKVGEYDQEIALSVFTPWFNALVAETNGDGYRLMQLIKEKLGIVT